VTRRTSFSSFQVLWWTLRAGAVFKATSCTRGGCRRDALQVIPAAGARPGRACQPPVRKPRTRRVTLAAARRLLPARARTRVRRLIAAALTAFKG
jgi:hypothetical protein